jgi:hypothetical protein
VQVLRRCCAGAVQVLCRCCAGAVPTAATGNNDMQSRQYIMAYLNFTTGRGRVWGAETTQVHDAGIVDQDS